MKERNIHRPAQVWTIGERQLQLEHTTEGRIAIHHKNPCPPELNDITFIGTFAASGQQVPPYVLFADADPHKHCLYASAETWCNVGITPDGRMSLAAGLYWLEAIDEVTDHL